MEGFYLVVVLFYAVLQNSFSGLQRAAGHVLVSVCPHVACDCPQVETQHCPTVALLGTSTKTTTSDCLECW